MRVFGRGVALSLNFLPILRSLSWLGCVGPQPLRGIALCRNDVYVCICQTTLSVVKHNIQLSLDHSCFRLPAVVKLYVTVAVDYIGNAVPVG